MYAGSARASRSTGALGSLHMTSMTFRIARRWRSRVSDRGAWVSTFTAIIYLSSRLPDRWSRCSAYNACCLRNCAPVYRCGSGFLHGCGGLPAFFDGGAADDALQFFAGVRFRFRPKSRSPRSRWSPDNHLAVHAIKHTIRWERCQRLGNVVEQPVRDLRILHRKYGTSRSCCHASKGIVVSTLLKNGRYVNCHLSLDSISLEETPRNRTSWPWRRYRECSLERTLYDMPSAPMAAAVLGPGELLRHTNGGVALVL